MCDISGSSSVSSSVEFLLDFNDTLEGCECKARARLSEAVDPLTCKRGPEAGVWTTMGERSTELGVADADRADSNVCSWLISGLVRSEPRDMCGS